MEYFISLRGILVLILSAAGIILTFKNPKFGLITYIILLFAKDPFLLAWFPPSYPTLHLPKIFGILTLISLFIHSKDYPPRLSLQFLLMILFFIVICLSRYLNDTAIFGHKASIEFFKMCVLFYLITNIIRDKKSFEEVIWVLIILNLFLTLYHYYYYKTGWQSIFVVPGYRTLDRNGFAATLVAMCPLAYVFLRERKHLLVRIILGFCLFSFIGGVILTRSRGGFLALVITSFLLILQDKKKTVPIFLFLIMGFLIGTRISEKYINRIKTIVQYESDPSAMRRVAVNYAAINMLKERPIIGFGAGNFNDMFLPYVPEDLKEYTEPGVSIHNTVLQVASETGFLGLIIFTLLIGKTLFGVIKLRKLCLNNEQLEPLAYMATGIAMAFLGYFAACQFIPGAYYSYLYIFLPLTTAALQIVRNSLAENR
ncbi:MAG: hypothetical protein DRG83_06435 [Deltaproteobacteria bacterium]|nr:MAG: hypothetical protein DRG83_06435 [Deltaproteobacteria bacterium]